ncbi:alpha/beta-hydrolase [Schizopora paradoxa]|uniref:Alpha/beta-hydrolase n=1 Tax=Schizopora paradoxa TaxID=27342 RepID=A0A0H2RL28_9AGAM|nr:alpha/beta-hydrolase [Schizopora paradoxa]
MGKGIFSLKRQPFKGLYVAICMLDLVLRIPWWTLRNLFPAWRPRKSWSIGWCLRVRAFKYMADLRARVGPLDDLPDAKALRAGPGVLGLYVDGVPQYITAKLKAWADLAGVSPVRIPGYWLHNPGSKLVMGEKPQVRSGDSKREKVLFSLHGGGYIVLSAHPDSFTSKIPRSVLAHCANISTNVMRSFNIEYRLSSYDPNPRENPFPAALLEAIAGYAYLVDEVGFDGADIIITGDSAGGNLALALTKYLIEENTKLPPPGALLLLSPWTDLGNSHKDDPMATYYTHKESDILHPPVRLPDGKIQPDYAVTSYTGPHGVEFAGANPYISPASLYLKDEEVSFKDFPPTFITCGGAELFVDQIKDLVRRMKSQMGEKVVYYEAEDAIHDYIAFDWQEPQRSETLVEIARWVTSL